jgi:hypothetical protein
MHIINDSTFFRYGKLAALWAVSPLKPVSIYTGIHITHLNEKMGNPEIASTKAQTER